MSRILLKNGEVVSSQVTLEKDVLIEDGKIVGLVDRGVDIDGEYEVVDCMDKLILPGVIDAHVHMREPGHEYKEDFESGTRAAVTGGVTTILDMPNNIPPTTTVEALEAKRKLLKGRAYTNYGFYIGFDGKNFDEIDKATNVCAVKVFVANSTGDMGVEGDSIAELFNRTDKLIVTHAEDEDIIQENSKKYLAEFEGRDVDPAVHSKIRSPEAAIKAVEYVCGLAKESGKRLHVAHVSTAGELEVIEKHREFGVTCEVAPHHLHITDDDYEHLESFIKVNPPVRSKLDVFALWAGVKHGSIDIIDTDHAPHSVEEKGGKYLDTPSGIPGVEMLLPIFLNTVDSEGLSINELVKLVCERPAEIFKIPNKGKIAEGYDADIVVVDVDIEKKVVRDMIQSKAGWSPYEGMVLKGWPVKTFVNGELVFDNGKIVGNMSGQEIKF